MFSMITKLSAVFGIIFGSMGLNNSPIDFEVKRQVASSSVVTEGYTAVYDDLLKFDIENLESYRSGIYSYNKMLHLIEDEEGFIYIYVYRSYEDLNFDKIDISTEIDYEDSNFIEKYKTLKLKLIDEETYLVKYQIEGLKANLSMKRRYAVRQIYNSETMNSVGEITAVALEYLISKDNNNNWYSQIRSLDNIEVDGISAFELRYLGKGEQGGGFRFSQRYYRAFNTSYKLEDILRVEVQFSCRIFSGITDIGMDLTDMNGDKLINDLSGLHRITSIDSSSTLIKETVSIKPKNVNYSIVKPWFFKKVDYSYDTISRVKDIDNVNKDLSNYEWVVTFYDNELFGIGTFINPFTTRWKVEDYLEIYNSSIMTMKVIHNGDIKELTVIDAYHENSGNIPIIPTEEYSIWERIIEAFTNVFKGKGDITDWIVVVLTIFFILIILWVLSFVFKILAGILSIFGRR